MMSICIKTLPVQTSHSRTPRPERRRKSRGERRRERIHRVAAWLMDMQDAFSDTAR
ncbi:MAG: hypothetical protein HY293_09170 [Planctomycetes bacterium]|nr:hypothetical protein [Planctomycetota bacterium]